MNIKWKKPHHLGTRLLQLAVVGGFTGLLYAGSPKTVTAYQETAAPVDSQTEAPDTERHTDDASNKKNDIFYPASDLADAFSNITELPPYFLTPEQKTAITSSYGRILSEHSLTFEELESELADMSGSYEGDWAIYIKDLKTEQVISLNNRSLEAASLIKLYVMGAVMEAIRKGDLTESSAIDTLLEDMITVSDNESTNELVRYLSDNHDHKEGLAVVNDFIQRHGFAQTVQVNGLADTSLHYSTGVNLTSVEDCGKLLEMIYQGQLVSHLASRKMENLLLSQKVEYKIPDALPSDVTIANKTGEVTGVENDVSIIYSDGGDFILCIMSSDGGYQDTTVKNIHQIANTVYDYFNPSRVEDKYEISGQDEEIYTIPKFRGGELYTTVSPENDASKVKVSKSELYTGIPPEINSPDIRVTEKEDDDKKGNNTDEIMGKAIQK